MTNNRPCRWFTCPSTATLNPPRPEPRPAWVPLPYLGWQQSTHCVTR